MEKALQQKHQAVVEIRQRLADQTWLDTHTRDEEAKQRAILETTLAEIAESE